jgi:hypothetical protein
MSNIEKTIALPLDEDGFFRRECPLCCKEFKILLSQEELTVLAQEGLDSFLLDKKDKAVDSDKEDGDDKKEYFCPYCGQQALYDQWWTKEQLAYVHVVAENIIASIMNESFINPLKSSLRGNSFIKFEAKELKQTEPWISPETNDMKVINLLCCQKKIKVEENWNQKTHCYFCGFPHQAGD